MTEEIQSETWEIEKQKNKNVIIKRQALRVLFKLSIATE